MQDTNNATIRNRGQGSLTALFGAFVLIATVIFIFSTIRKPSGVPPETMPDGEAPILVDEIPDESIAEMNGIVEERRMNFPIAAILPYGGPLYGKAFFIHTPKQDGEILIELDNSQDEASLRQEAMDWIASQGYDPSNLNITFKSKKFPEVSQP